MKCLFNIFLDYLKFDAPCVHFWFTRCFFVYRALLLVSAVFIGELTNGSALDTFEARG
jgi:hypothetical protein